MIYNCEKNGDKGSLRREGHNKSNGLLGKHER